MTLAETGFGLAYALAALLSLAAALRCRRAGSREAWAWLTVAAALALFALLRMTAIHEGAVAWLRVLAHEQGWYDGRKALQGALLELLTGAALLVLALFAVGVRFLRPAILCASSCVLLLAMLSLARAMSFHRLDHLLQRPLGPLNFAQAEEAILLLFACGAAISAATKKGAATSRGCALELSQAEEA